MFHVGQQVVCIRDKWIAPYNERCPAQGNVYTIRNVETRCYDNGYCGLRFEEIVNPVNQYRQARAEPCFSSKYFRPVRKTDISIFTQMLNPVRETEKA